MICTLCFITWISTFVQCASTPRGFCGGPARCCRGHKWDAQTESCVGCQHPYYGLLCQYVCDCTEPNCNMFDGCRTTPISTDIACCQHTWTFHTCTTHHNDIQMES
ncbi:uncharacterized protein LOC125674994 isoform X4 [Ostrea edulis]|uniref:uncharacterized protein LOC125674994 isoform X4 n=1 Tax=Ostrea edulis TaxID=37623 RepID=UPI0024AECE1F|nr:uncharacterized protein LOC125674994 isoform X4 [Ostrea edulis]